MEKYQLNQATRRKYLMHTLFNGIRNIFTNRKSALLFILCAALFSVFLNLWKNLSPAYLQAFMNTVCIILFVFALPVLIAMQGYTKGSLPIYNDFCRAGWNNAAGEAPYLLSRAQDGDIEILSFQCKGMPLQTWLDNRELISSALNRYLVSIEQGNRLQEIIVRCVEFDNVIGAVIPWEDSMTDYTDDSKIKLGRSLAGDVVVSLDTCPHWMIASASGGGKTNICLCILAQMQLRDALVYIYDGKGGLDYLPIIMRGAELAKTAESFLEHLQQIVSEMERRFEAFNSVHATTIQDYRKLSGETLPRIVLLVDEVSTVLDKHGKNTKQKEIIDKIIELLSQIAQTGRVVGVHSIYAMQNPSRQELPSAVQVNTDKLCGKGDTVLSQMVLNSSIADTIPKKSHGIFYLSAGAETTQFQSYYFRNKYKAEE